MKERKSRGLIPVGVAGHKENKEGRNIMYSCMKI
jgi:hypothetical protein